MLIMTTKGLYCPRGNFYIDPKGSVEHAVVTHAHSDHARKGSKHYYCAASGAALLKVRLGEFISVKAIPYREKFNIKDVVISFHPAGHILGSSQVRIEFNSEVWVVSGDYKRDLDPTCEPFETVLCDVFITEATFGTPAYSWKKEINFGGEIFNWWNKNSRAGFNSVLFAYSLGKAQRILGYLRPYTEIPIVCQSGTEMLTACYRKEGIELSPTISIEQLELTSIRQENLFLVSPSFLSTKQADVLGKKYRTAFASGWMARNNYRYDAGFVISDHADWDDLLRTIAESKARQVYVQHRGNGALVKELKSWGISASSDLALFPKHPHQLALL